MNVERLIVLADALDAWQPSFRANEFDLGCWHVERSCGTAVCAVGLAATLPELRAAGFKLYRGRIFNVSYPSYLGIRGWPAVERFFDVSEDTATYLFGPESYDESERSNPRVVARRLRELVAAYAADPTASW
jgi:hypothetical protein